MRKINLVGERFGNLFVVDFFEAKKKGSYFKCLCDCGKVTISRSSKLRCGRKKSCGCKQYEANKTHGLTRSKEYIVWSSMISRCENKKNKSYKRYGARGISVCESWRKSFPRFLKDVGGAPKGKTLGRINNSVGYCKRNCRWETYTEQARNRRSSVYVYFLGKKTPITVACRLAGVSVSRVYRLSEKTKNKQRAFALLLQEKK